MQNENYEEANVSVIVDSEAGPITIQNFVGNSYPLLTTEATDYDSSYDDYEDMEDIYEDRSSKDNEFDLPIGNITTIETLWNGLNTLNSIWNTYFKLNGKDKIKRQVEENLTKIEEGRYIKGDPLKGYYDFVITEGSYKFWAAFQLATAVLIIYSTFAAIYYSKVNPLVGDYDYVDYLGGGRSFSDDSDFVDASADNNVSEKKSENLFDDSERNSSNAVYAPFHNWLPKLKYSMKFILNAVDKLPVRD